MSLLRILGAVLAGLGVIMAVFPSWCGMPSGGTEPPVDTFVGRPSATVQLGAIV